MKTIHRFLIVSECKNEVHIQWPKPPISPISTAQSIKDLINRVLDNAPSANLFEVQINPQLAVNDKDVFQLSNGASSGTVLISASSGVAAAMGFNYYLKYIGDSSCMYRMFTRFTFISCDNKCCFLHSLLVGKKYSTIQFITSTVTIDDSNHC